MISHYDIETKKRITDILKKVKQRASKPKKIKSPTRRRLLFGDRPICPKCGSFYVIKAGVRRNPLGSRQRWLCKDCNLSFYDLRDGKMMRYREYHLELMEAYEEAKITTNPISGYINSPKGYY